MENTEETFREEVQKSVHKHKKRVLSTPQQNSQQMVMMTY
jgi:hypothetical protein